MFACSPENNIAKPSKIIKQKWSQGFVTVCPETLDLDGFQCCDLSAVYVLTMGPCPVAGCRLLCWQGTAGGLFGQQREAPAVPAGDHRMADS